MTCAVFNAVNLFAFGIYLLLTFLFVSVTVMRVGVHMFFFSVLVQFVTCINTVNYMVSKTQSPIKGQAALIHLSLIHI